MAGELTIVGMGMIGGSFALALRGQFDRISMLEPDDGHAAYALNAGLADQRVDEVPGDAAAVLLACPSDRIAGWVARLAGHPGTVFDAGSVKGAVIAEIRSQCDALPGNYVPSHPIAGLERSGPEAADADLFRNRKVILTPIAETLASRIDAVEGWWQAAGATCERMDPETHDRTYARTSHLPHLLAFAYLLGIDTDDLAHTGGGFRDFSRIGGSDPVMWAGIFGRNAPALLAALDVFESNLGEFRQAIESNDPDRCRALIARARQRREEP